MLTLQLENGTYLDLAPEAAITVRRYFGFFEFAEAEGSYTFPFSLPQTGKNLRALGFPNRVNNANFNLKHNVVIRHSGLYMFAGSMEVESTGTALECSVAVEAGAFWEKTKDLKLNEIIVDYGNGITGPILERFGDTEAEQEAYMFEANGFAYPDKACCLPPIYTPNIDFSLIGTFDGKYINFMGNDGTLFTDYKKTWYPQYYLCYVLDKLMDNYGYKIEDSFLHSHAEFSQLAIFTMRKELSNIADYFNFSSEYLPSLTIHDFIKSLEKLLCIKFNFTEFTLSIIDVNGNLTNTAYVDYTAYAAPEKELQFEKLPTVVLVQAPDTYEPEPETGTAFSVLNKVADYNAKYETTAQNTLNNAQNHKTEITAVCNDIQFKLADDLSIPRTDYDNIFDTENLESLEPTANLPMKLMFYRGIFEYTKVINFEERTLYYPYATRTNTHPQPPYAAIPNTEHTLDWEGEYGLYEKRWKNYYTWYYNTRKKVTLYLHLSPAQVGALQSQKRIRVLNTNYFVNAIEYTLTGNGISVVRVDGFVAD